MSQPIARFTQGNLWRHVSVMSLTNATGLMMVFLVDFIDIYFISLLGESALAAGVGFAGSVLFFVRSIALALAITTSVLVSRHLGMNDRDGAARMAMNIPLLGFVIIAVVATIAFIFRDTLLAWVGASGPTKQYAADYLAIVIPGTLAMLLGMCGGQIIRAMGEAKLSMWIAITGALTNAVLDPIFIFVFDWGLSGAAWATVASQVVALSLSWWAIIGRFRLITRWSFSAWLQDISPAMAIAFPSVLTNIATPFSAAFAARMMAPFGDGAVAAFAVVMRLVPMSLAVVFALSGAVAPIVGQNAGAGRFDRVRDTLWQALKFNWLVVVAMTTVLFLLRHQLPHWFSLNDEAVELLVLFCSGMTLLFGFNGMIFFLNASFNNLGRPFYSTLTNLARVLLGSVPLVYLGQHLFGARGVLYGYMSEGIIVSIIGWLVAQRLVARYESGELQLRRQRRRDQRRSAALWPFSKRWP
ncbi:MATE family efflux transporter [Suttonella sp. R2A3]|uniref:MATE family efflux transporter n=1 Tax=Suttonella sp. R2A3 TaxID=2908648 RepID=UPI001F484752|nr:MATE family efflux transporter [Suttonella sp. R2A3]UJF24153.1 MATE family efflux transporter [Suttonella sp. R2A3]